MRSCSLTLRTALTLSVAIHVALFGSALAFARFSGPLFPADYSSISVLLVGPGSGPRPAVTSRKDARPAPVKTTAEPEQALLPEREVGERIAPPEASPEGAVKGPEARPAIENSPGGLSDPSSEAWLHIQEAIERAKTYPRFAREMGIEGTVLVRFKVQPTGGIERIDIVKSSGAKILDEASVRTVRRAAPMPFVEGWVEVPLVYELKRTRY